MPMCENQNGSTNRHLPSWFTKIIVLNEYIKDMESRIKGNTFVHSLNRNHPKQTVRETFIVAIINNCDHKLNFVEFLLKRMFYNFPRRSY
jgi:hypothetical protein